MSAFFVAAPTIDAAISCFIDQEGPLGPEAATALGRELWALNAEAVRWRYDLDARGEEERLEHQANLAEAAAYAWRPRRLTPAVMVKSLDCLRYQCHEGPVIETALHKRLAALANSFDAGGIREGEAYGRAPWGLDGPTPGDGPHIRTELTPEGEQFVIPGCERNRSPLLRQLDLFG